MFTTYMCLLRTSSSILETVHITVVSHYYDTAEIRKKYHNIQTIEISNF